MLSLPFGKQLSEVYLSLLSLQLRIYFFNIISVYWYL